MFSRIRSSLTYANVASSIALFLALSTGAAYAANTVFSQDIVNGEVKTADLANNAVTTRKLAANSVKTSKVQDGTLQTGDIAVGAVTGALILDGTIQTVDLAVGAVTGAIILDGTVQTVDLADGAVNGNKIADESLTGAEIMNDNDPSGLGGLNAVDLSTNSVGAAEIQTDGVQATEIANDSIDSGEVVDFSLTNQDVGVLFAQVNADGTLANSSGGVTVSKISVGTYEVDYGRVISNCAFVTTQGEAGAGGAGGAITGNTDRSGNSEATFTTTRNDANVLVDRAFQQIVVC